VTDVKNHEHQEIPRVPFILTTNEENIAERCNAVDQDAIRNRLFCFKFDHQINNGLTISTGIAQAPAQINVHDLYGLILNKREKIEKYITDITTVML
jgi:hypothetical protein